MPPDGVLEDRRRGDVAVERARDGVDRAAADLVALVGEVGELAHHERRRRDGLGVAVERHDVAAQEELAVDVLLELAQHVVAVAGECGRSLV